MGWFTRVKEGITTSTEEKKETPEGLWYKCPECKEVMTAEDHEDNLWVCNKCEYHEKIGSAEYFALLFDEHKYTEIAAELIAGDPLQFEDTKKYTDRLAKTRKDTGLNDALRAAEGKLDQHMVVIACMDFRFIGGSMGSVVGEKIARAAWRPQHRRTQGPGRLRRPARGARNHRPRPAGRLPDQRVRPGARLS
jgi:acetyl-CoA carboxylase carboxyl transferase subunit beta